jgi:hypothetical protein
MNNATQHYANPVNLRPKAGTGYDTEAVFGPCGRWRTEIRIGRGSRKNAIRHSSACLQERKLYLEKNLLQGTG